MDALASAYIRTVYGSGLSGQEPEGRFSGQAEDRSWMGFGPSTGPPGDNAVLIPFGSEKQPVSAGWDA